MLFISARVEIHHHGTNSHFSGFSHTAFFIVVAALKIWQKTNKLARCDLSVCGSKNLVDNTQSCHSIVTSFPTATIRMKNPYTI